MLSKTSLQLNEHPPICNSPANIQTSVYVAVAFDKILVVVDNFAVAFD